MKRIQDHKHEPTESTRAQVIALVAFGLTHEAIADFIDVSPPTLKLHYKRELLVGRDRMTERVASFMHNAASGEAIKDGATHADCIRAATFWLKTRAGWKETSDHNVDVTNSDGSMRPTTIMVVAGGQDSKD